MTPPAAPSSSPHRRLVVSLGERSYRIEIGPGLLAKAGARIRDLAGQVACVIVTDETVAKHHLAKLEASVQAALTYKGAIVLPPGEATKSWVHLEALVDQLLAKEIERGDIILLLGGGVIGDLGGFAASILRRGVRFVQLPTTLLAQVDSSVGGKTAINSPRGKNLIGTFAQPSLVLADLETLATLPAREFRAGYAEVVKYGLIDRPSFFTWLEQNRDAIFRQDPGALAHAVAVSCHAKAAIVGEDEREMGRRALLNLGHTFGHALEAWCGYTDRLRHGEAVAIGMVLAFALSEELGFCPPGRSQRIAAHLAAAGLPTHIRDMGGNARPTAEELLTHMAQDKKMAGGRLTLVLAREIGAAFLTRDVGQDQLHDFLTRKCDEA